MQVRDVMGQEKMIALPLPVAPSGGKDGDPGGSAAGRTLGARARLGPRPVEPKEPERAKREAVGVPEASQRLLRLRVHEDTGRIQVQVLNRSTGEVLEAIPPEEILKLAVELRRLSAKAFDRKA